MLFFGFGSRFYGIRTKFNWILWVGVGLCYLAPESLDFFLWKQKAWILTENPLDFTCIKFVFFFFFFSPETKSLVFLLKIHWILRVLIFIYLNI